MAAGPAVVIPWRGGCPHRERALGWVAGRYETLGWPIYLGTIEGPWCKAIALQQGIERAEADVLIIADADVWCDNGTDTGPLERAVDLVTTGQALWAVPHLEVARLDREATDQVLLGTPPAEASGLAEKPYRGRVGGGLLVITRDLWNVCPMDPRFIGWGQEDEAWGHALIGTVGRPTRREGVLWHLWHPPQPRRNRGIGSAEGLALAKRYILAARHPDQLAALLDEARAALQEAA